ncbi:GNAT family N-acetyltransferase [Candidatus Gottesmanbacteria bacterium]|nr:GNAT family N-acetyltransferase [Candidatus Gottesmanbacteria bacterium]
MNVRVATSNDKTQVLKLFDEFSLMIKAKDIPSKVGSYMFDEIISRTDTKIFIVEEKGQLLGLATFYLLPNIRHGLKRGHIEDFFITGKARGKGIGTFLFSSIKDYCRKNNIKVIKLHSGNDLVRAHHFYEKSGGKTTERFFRFDIG